MTQEKVKLIVKLRQERGMNKAKLARATGMQQGTIGWIESGRFIPYDSQLEKIATALEWDGDLHDLLKEVG